MTDNFELENLADQYDEQVSANLLIAKEGSRRALRLLVPTLAKMFIDDVPIGKSLPGTLYYDSSKDLEGENTHYFIHEIPKNDKHRVYILFFKHPMTHVPPRDPRRPYAIFMAPDLKRHLHTNQLHDFKGDGSWVEFECTSSAAKITNLPLLKEIIISLPAVHITGRIHPGHHLDHLQERPFDAQGILYYQDYQSLETAHYALYSTDSIVFYTKEDVKSDQIAFRLVILPCLQDKAGSLVLCGRIKQYEGTGEITIIRPNCRILAL